MSPRREPRVEEGKRGDRRADSPRGRRRDADNDNGREGSAEGRSRHRQNGEGGGESEQAATRRGRGRGDSESPEREERGQDADDKGPRTEGKDRESGDDTAVKQSPSEEGTKETESGVRNATP